MKKLLNMFLLLTIFILSTNMALNAQGLKKNLRLGYVHWTIVDSFDEGEGSYGYGESQYYYDGYRSTGSVFKTKAVLFGCKNWTDESGTLHPIKISGHGHWETDDINIMMPVPDDEGFTIHRYYRYQPPDIIIDGVNWQKESFPKNQTDHVDPGKLPGTSDGMVESLVHSDMGISVRHKAIVYDQQNHDKYLIHEYIFKNTGNTDLDEEIELPNQTIEDFYFLKQIRYRELSSIMKSWASAYGQYAEDDIRICYGYGARYSNFEDDYGGGTTDDYGNQFGQFQYLHFYGDAIIFASISPDQYDMDDVNQPRVSAYLDVDFLGFIYHPGNMTTEQKNLCYQVMQEGAVNLEDIFWPELDGTKPGHHSVPLDHRGFPRPNDMEGFGYAASSAYSIGPYSLDFGDSIKIVIADVYGALSSEKGHEVWTTWTNNDAHWGDDIPGGATEILPPQYQAHTELYMSSDGKSDTINWAKDNWLFTGKDSLFKNARAAQWAYNNDYIVPSAPPPPSIEITSSKGYVDIAWDQAAESASDFAGYRVYRAKESYYPHVPVGETELIGNWELVYECGEGTQVPISHEFRDSAEVGIRYYYSVTAFDSGVENPLDFHGKKESLESSKFATMSLNAAMVLGINEGEHNKPYSFQLYQNFPNPFNPITNIKFTLPKKSKVSIKIYNVLGKEIDILVSEKLAAGIHSYSFDGSNLASGIYLYKIDAEEFQDVKKMILIK